MSGLPAGIESRLAELPAGLRDHIERSRAVGRDLAARHGVDPRAVDVGIAAHDLARALDAEGLLSEALCRGLTVTPVESHAPVLLHGPIAAEWLSREGGYGDPAVLDAVRWHTTGRPGMADIAKVVFLADKLDPQKVESSPYLAKVESLAVGDLDEAMLEYLDREIEYLVGNGRPVHPASVDLRNELLLGPTNADRAPGARHGRSVHRT